MQTYLPIIKALLSEWYLFTLNNALYAAALAIVVWLLTTILYSFKIAALKRGQIASEKLGVENLNIAQQQLQHSQQELAAAALQAEKATRAAEDETQRALGLEQLIYQRNQQVAGIIQILATSFDLGERPLLASEDVKAEALWQQHDKVITQLIERLRTELKAKVELQQSHQTNTAKLAEKDALLGALQTTLASHSNQLSKIEHALEEQKAMLQQQDNAQQVFSDTLKKFQPDLAQPVKLEQNTAAIWQQPAQQEESPKIEEPLIVQQSPVIQAVEEAQTELAWQHEESPITDQSTAPTSDVNFEAIEQEAPAESVDEEPQQPITAAKGTFGKIKKLFGKESAIPAQSAAQESIDIDELPPAEQESPVISSAVEQEAANPSSGSIGKIKTLFGKSKQQPIKTEPQWTDAPSEANEVQPFTEQQTEDVTETAEKKPGKLKGFYSKFRSGK